MKFRACWLVIFGLMTAIGAAACSRSASGDGAAQNNSAAGNAASTGAGGVAANSGAGEVGALPGGFQSVTDADGSGQLLWAKVGAGQRSAKGAMRDSFGALKNYFDAPPQLLSAVSDSQDRVVQVVLAANFKGQPVNGIATTIIGSVGGVFGLVFDRPAALKTSFANLSKTFRAQLPQSTAGGGAFSLAAPASWTRQTAGDRSCAVNIPSGWKPQGCAEGTMTIFGPRGEYVALGQITFVASQALPGTQGIVSPYLQPVPAFTLFVNYLTRMNRASGVNLINVMGRVVESKAVAAPMQGGEGAYLLQEMTVNGTPYKIYALVYTARLPMSGWQFYTSYVSAPAGNFEAEFPDLMRIWSSWKVDDRVYQQIMQQTLQTMKSTSDMINHSTEQEIGSFENLQSNMLNIINGDESVANTTTGARQTVSIQNAANVLQGCKASGYDCQVLPVGQITGGH